MFICRRCRKVTFRRPGEMQMESNVSDVIVGLMMALFGLIGLFLIAGAADDEMYVFGLGLSGFAVVFDLGLIKRHYDRRDIALAAVRDVARIAVRKEVHV
jgi:hypothetical protein